MNYGIYSEIDRLLLHRHPVWTVFVSQTPHQCRRMLIHVGHLLVIFFLLKSTQRFFFSLKPNKCVESMLKQVAKKQSILHAIRSGRTCI